MLSRPLRILVLNGALFSASGLLAPAAALTITPYFDSSIVGAGNQIAVESVIYSAIGTIDGLYSNPGTIGIVFSQANGTYLATSQTTDSFLSYSFYISKLAAASLRDSTNTTLATAVAHLASGNNANGAKQVAVTTADLKLGLGLSGVSGCFSTSGAYVGSCGQSAYGVVTLTNNPAYSLNYTTGAVAGAYNMISAVEHEIDEILGGGGQGSMLNAVLAGASPFNGAVGVLDLYRYSAPGTPSFTTSSSATAYFSVDGGTTVIVGFNQNSSGDFADFAGTTNVQSAFSASGIAEQYTASSPEFMMMEAIGYNGVVPEPGSMAVLATGLIGLRSVRRRRRQTVQ